MSCKTKRKIIGHLYSSLVPQYSEYKKPQKYSVINGMDLCDAINSAVMNLPICMLSVVLFGYPKYLFCR